jgi:hypothetical protein
LIPSSDCFSFGTPFILSISGSGTSIPGTEFFMYFAIPTDLNGVTPAKIATLSCNPRSLTISIHFENRSKL